MSRMYNAGALGFVTLFGVLTGMQYDVQFWQTRVDRD